ncbi:DNA polymerase III subunit delta' [Nitrosomonas nitrosa]|uniref:DNA polymerase III subunit delta' n=1 Tax=Nitrosomonas nitrosa TaxID=52442 RepID=UPI0030B8033D
MEELEELYPWQNTLWQQLRRAEEMRAHALLLKGRKGIGKLSFAYALAKSLLCERVTARLTACGQCASCRWFTQGTHPNFYLIAPEAFTSAPSDAALESDEDRLENDTVKSRKKASQQITIDQVRSLDHFVYFSGHQAGYKVILIHPAEAMNAAAANALLKKLEEPPAHVLFLLIAHQWQDLLPTIRSRCQQITMPVPDTVTACDWLIQQGVDPPETYLALAGASPLQAKMFSQGDYLVQHAEFIRQMGLPERLDPISLSSALSKLDLSMLVNWLQKWCYDLMSCRVTGKVRYHLQHETTIRKLAATINPLQFAQFWRDLIKTQRLSQHPLNTKLFIEEMLFSYMSVMVPGRYRE